MLIDFTRLFTTFAIASPEVKGPWSVSKGASGEIIDGGEKNSGFKNTTALGIPPEWPIEAAEKSEVYSIGRTLFLVSASMIRLYLEMGWTNESDFPVSFGESSKTPPELQQIILRCVQQPSRRPSLVELSSNLERAAILLRP